jgi:hypothetical protein
MVRAAWSLGFCVIFCRLGIVLLSFFLCPFHCLSFCDLRLLITPVVSSNLSRVLCSLVVSECVCLRYIDPEYFCTECVCLYRVCCYWFSTPVGYLASVLDLKQLSLGISVPNTEVENQYSPSVQSTQLVAYLPELDKHLPCSNLISAQFWNSIIWRHNHFTQKGDVEPIKLI